MRLSPLAFVGSLLVGGFAGAVDIQVDTTQTHQRLEGFGATTSSLKYGDTDNVPSALRPAANAAAYRDVHLNMGNLEVGPFESPSTSLYSPANDDGDPNTFNDAGFNWQQSDNLVDLIVAPGEAYGFDDYWLGPAISETYELAWAKAQRSSDYNAYLDECAEHVAALAIHWRDAYGRTPALMQLWNEPLSGNTEMSGATAQTLTDIVKRAGARLRAEGFSQLKFVVPADETETLSYDEAAAILSDPVAAQYVGAIAYHPYPYGSTYASVPNILATSGSGNPSATSIAIRNQLRDLGAQHGIPVFMVEVSHSEVAFRDFAGLRGRAIHIHDELIYADAAAFFGMNAFWDTVSNDQHYAGRTNPGLYADTDTIVLIEDGAGQTPGVFITETGYAIGHYARWLSRGSVRVDATSTDALVQVSAFRDDSQGRVVAVLINNTNSAQPAQVSVTGTQLDSSRAVEGETSVAGAYWTPLTGVTATSTGFSTALPPMSVTTVAARIAGWSAPDGGAADGGTGLDGGGASDGGAGSDGGAASDGGSGSDGGADLAGVDAGTGGGASGRCGCDAAPGGLLLLAVASLLTVARRRSR